MQLVAFDADDTLWYSQRGFDALEEQVYDLLADYGKPDEINARLYATEMANMAHFGYGVKAFTLSLIETALSVSGGEIEARVIERILAAGKDLLAEPVELLPGAIEAVEHAGAGHKLLLVTKGDLLHQERKLAESGLADCFYRVDIVSEKDVATYARVLEEERVDASEFLMVGNSIRSDVLPVLEVGGWAVHVPHERTWQHEQVADSPTKTDRAFQIDTLEALPPLLDKLTDLTAAEGP